MEQDNLDEHEYRLLGSEELSGEACYRIEGIAVSESKKKETNYSKREFWIRKQDFALKKIEYYDKKGSLLKILTASDIRMINDKPRAHQLTMENVQTNHTTDLLYHDIKLDQGLPERLFTERELVKE